MNYLDAVRQIQRMLDSFEPIRRQIESDMTLRLLLDDRFGIRAAELAEHYQAFQASIPDLQSLRATSHALGYAVRALPDLSAALSATDWEHLGPAYLRLSDAVADASTVGELDLEYDEDKPNEDLEKQIHGQLVELVPPETLDRLRQVEFAPICVLDRVLRDPETMRALEARDFESFIAALVDELGFENVVLTPRSGDEGRDVVATMTVHGISMVCAFECKRYAQDRPVGPDIARALLGVITHGSTRATKGIVVTTSSFTPAATKFILTEPSLDGRDFDGVVKWLQTYASKRGRMT